MKLNKDNMDELMFALLEGQIKDKEAYELRKQIDADPYMSYQFGLWKQTITETGDFGLPGNETAFVESLIKKPEKKRYYLLPYISAAASILLTGFLLYRIYYNEQVPLSVVKYERNEGRHHTDTSATKTATNQPQQSTHNTGLSAYSGRQNQNTSSDSMPLQLDRIVENNFQAPVPIVPAFRRNIDSLTPSQIPTQQTKVSETFVLVAVSENTESDIAAVPAGEKHTREWPKLLTNTKLRFRKSGKGPDLIVEGEERYIFTFHLTDNHIKF